MDSAVPDGGGSFVGQLGYGIIIFAGILMVIALMSIAAHYCTHDNNPIARLTNRSRTALHEHLVVSEIGLDEETIMSYPKMLYEEVATVNNAQNDILANCSCCSICLMDYKAEDELRLLPECHHHFHQKCVDRWLRLHTTCPICRNSPMPTPVSSPLARGGSPNWLDIGHDTAQQSFNVP